MMTVENKINELWYVAVPFSETDFLPPGPVLCFLLSNVITAQEFLRKWKGIKERNRLRSQQSNLYLISIL